MTPRRANADNTPRAHDGQRQRGMAMLDALIAALIASAGFMALTVAHANLMHEAAYSRDQGHALRAASQRMEIIRSASQWADVDDGIDVVHATAATSLHRRWSIQGLAGDDDLRRVEVAVTWTDGHGHEQQVRLRSLIDKPDPSRMGLLVLARRDLALTP